MGTGFLNIEIFAGDSLMPISDVNVIVKDCTGNVMLNKNSDENGSIKGIALPAPNAANSLTPNNPDGAFSVYVIEVSSPVGYKPIIISGAQIFDGITGIQPIRLEHLTPGSIGDFDVIDIPNERGLDLVHKQITPSQRSCEGSLNEAPELAPLNVPVADPIFVPTITHKPTTKKSKSAASLKTPMQIENYPRANDLPIPTHIVVHLGSPSSTAKNVRVPFKDYIKNVASSEIYPTWCQAAIVANILALISFTLNRMYTVFYRSAGYDFDITNNTAYDQFFVEGRTIYSNISEVVDQVFNNPLRRDGFKEPFFASYCNGTTATCSGMSQWGSQALALKGFSPMEILRYYYPKDILIFESINFIGNYGVYPGYLLTMKSKGDNVKRMQQYLNRISIKWKIPTCGEPDGIFGSLTKDSVSAFQKIFNLNADGAIGKDTWYEITRVYSAVYELDELTSEGERIGVGSVPPTSTLRSVARGEEVVILQFLLNYIAKFFPTIAPVTPDGVFGKSVERAVKDFQNTFGLTINGVVDPETWDMLFKIYNAILGFAIASGVLSATEYKYPDSALKSGSSGPDVLFIQKLLNALRFAYPIIPAIASDGVYGSGTEEAAKTFQQLFDLAADGVIGTNTWNLLTESYKKMPLFDDLPVYPGYPLRKGYASDAVKNMQVMLLLISEADESLPLIAADGVFGNDTLKLVQAFQGKYNLPQDGIVGVKTWEMIVSIYNKERASQESTPSPTPSTQSKTAPNADNRSNALTVLFNLSQVGL